ncbi:MAG: pseudouridine synthase [Melioribacter sp.]|uniref:pseudouridine synthase n=1 Tax=Rosettibacter primus TaxID=3111523 RepID=UPI00247C6764|nr:pseudouridine synthase [Melioribacter sp.]
MKKTLKYFALNKPYGVLSQFTDKHGRRTLKSLYNFPKDVYPVGRLDMDSEGLLLLTNDKFLTNYLLNPKNKHEKEYFVQVEGIPTSESLQKLRDGVEIEGKKTLPAKVKIIEEPDFPPRIPPIRERKNIPTSWISITLIEGRNRQVRKMTAAVGFPTLRLVRVRIKNILLGDLKFGEVRELTKNEIEGLFK